MTKERWKYYQKEIQRLRDVDKRRAEGVEEDGLQEEHASYRVVVKKKNNNKKLKLWQNIKLTLK